MPRVTPLNYSELSNPIESLIDDFSNENKDFTNQIRVLAHSPASCEHLYGLVKAIENTGELPKRVIEIAVVTRAWSTPVNIAWVTMVLHWFRAACRHKL